MAKEGQEDLIFELDSTEPINRRSKEQKEENEGVAIHEHEE